MHTPNPQSDLERRKRLRFVVIVLLIVGASTLSAFANPSVKTAWQYYTVTATTPQGLRSQMLQLRGDDVWGVTRWQVDWTASCRVSVDIIYTIPRHARRSAMPADLLARWDRMIVALRSHEQRHGSHAVRAGREMVQQNCRNAGGIIAKWEEQDRLYDQVTGHGRTEGAVFP
ncbi:MAG: DUF922 domain-containing protein [Pseudomonadota bacterium]